MTVSGYATGTIQQCPKLRDRRVLWRTPKFYLFHVGGAGALVKRRIAEPRGEQFGRALEHFILLELAAHASYSELQYDIHFWRTRSSLEVDFSLGEREVAVKVEGFITRPPTGNCVRCAAFVKNIGRRLRCW